MQIASFESTYPVMGAIKWQKHYIAMLATPLAVRDVMAGHLLFIAMRIGTTCRVYVAVIALFGGAVAPTSLLALPAALLVGMAFAANRGIRRRRTTPASPGLFRFGIIPLSCSPARSSRCRSCPRSFSRSPTSRRCGTASSSAAA